MRLVCSKDGKTARQKHCGRRQGGGAAGSSEARACGRSPQEEEDGALSECVCGLISPLDCPSQGAQGKY